MTEEKDNFVCKVCGQSFKSRKGLHIHLKKHQMDLATYYTTYYPRKNLLTNDPLPFKNFDDYFEKDFSTRNQLIKWCLKEDKKTASSYILEKLQSRIESKGLKKAPNHLELKLAGLPDIDVYKHIFGSYSEACKKIKIKPLFDKRVHKDFFKDSKLFEDLKIFIDTREQQPLEFKNSDSLKLDFGDYTTGGDDYSYTYIDRKSEGDFKSTLSGGFSRFKRELERVKKFESFLFILVESDLNKIYKNNLWGPHKSNLKFVYHNMRLLTHEFNGHCQFVFSGSRENSEKLVPKILKLGKKLWYSDLQYYIDKNELD